MLYIISVLLACAVSVQTKDVSLSGDRLSPPMVKKPASTKIEVPELLADTHLVDDPAELLETLRDTQQTAWEQLKTAQVRAWYCFHNNNGPKAVTWLIDYSCAKHAAQFKELKFNSSKMMQEAKAGRKYDPVGVDPDDEDAWHCLNASIDTPQMKVKAMFTTFMRPDNLQMLTIFPPGNARSSIVDLETRQFGFAVSPKEFYGEVLPRVIMDGGKLAVRQKGDLVELDFTDPKDRRTSRKIYRYDLAKNASAVATYTRSLRRETEFQNVANVWVPVLAKEQSIHRYSEMSFFDWMVNGELEQNEFSLKSLPMADDTVVNDKRVTPPARTLFRTWAE